MALHDEVPDTRVAHRSALPQPVESLRFTAWHPEAEADASGLRAYLRQLRERLWLVLVVVAVFVAAAAIYSATVQPQFEARAQLLIEPERPNVVAFADVIDDQGSKTDYYQTQYQVLRSRMLARRTMDVLQLWKRPEFAQPPSRIERTLAWVGLGSESEEVPDEVGPRSVNEESRAIGRFLSALTIEPIRNSRLLNVRFLSPDPKVASDVVNTLVRAYIERELQFKVDASRQARAWLDERVARQREAVQEAEEALQRYRLANRSLPLEGRRDLVAQRLGELNTAATRARTERIEKEAAFGEWQALAASGAASGVLPPAPGHAAYEDARGTLAKLQQQRSALARDLGDRHPELMAIDGEIAQAEARVRAEANRALESTRADLMVARAKEAQLARALDSQTRLAQGADQQAIDYGLQQREASSRRQMFEALLQRAQETAVSGELKTSNVRIVDLADVPTAPALPRRGLLLSLAAFAGTGVALGLVLVLGHLDDRLRSGEDVRRWLDVDHVGNVPTVPRKILRRGEVVADDSGADGFTEALRMIRTNLAFLNEGAGPRAIVVTSTTRGEGKTLLATNLAVALSQARQRVLLVDADMRRPRLHAIFGMAREPGLADLLISPRLGDSVLRDLDQANLTLLPAGTEPEQAGDLLGFDPVAQTLASLDRTFDWVIFDAPPVEAAADACLLAHRQARVLFVVAGRRISRVAARAAVDRLSSAGADFIGAVLTRMTGQPIDYQY